MHKFNSDSVEIAFDDVGQGEPVLLIHGEQDRLVPVLAARKVAAEHPAWDTAFLPDVGHTPQLEAPHAVVEAVLTWLDQQDLATKETP